MIAQFRATDAFAGVVPLAQSTVYDATLARELSTPTDAMLAVDVPVTILCGQQTFPFLSAAAERLAAAMPHAELIVSPSRSVIDSMRTRRRGSWRRGSPDAQPARQSVRRRPRTTSVTTPVATRTGGPS
jgi:hypothetical protein